MTYTKYMRSGDFYMDVLSTRIPALLIPAADATA